MGQAADSLDEGEMTPPPKARTRAFQSHPDAAGTPMAHRRSDRIRKQALKYAKDTKDVGDAITTPRGSSIHPIYPKDLLIPPSPRRVELDQYKRRLQFKSRAGSNLMITGEYKSIERSEKLRAFRLDQRGKRDTAQLKSRGLSLPAASKTRQTSVSAPIREGEAPSVQFIPRHNLRPRPPRSSVLGIEQKSFSDRPAKGSSTLEKRKSQYKLVKEQRSVNFVSWEERDDEWRKRRLDSYLESSKSKRQDTLFKKRNLNICGWGNPRKNLGNYLSICWEYNPDLDEDEVQKLPDRNPAILNRHDDKGVCVETGWIYYPDTISDKDKEYVNGYCFTIQSELALQYEAAQRVLFGQASELVRASFHQYNMELSLDSSLDDQFTVDIFVSSVPSTDMSDITVRGVTQFILMKGYVYVDKLCVSAEYQKKGIGTLMMDRIFQIAGKRKKDVLLYALGPVVKMYQNWGFEYCKEWPAIPKDIGVIMRKRIATKDVVNNYAGLTWDGTGFS